MTDPLAITILGAGYVGLVTGACLAAKGHRVRVLDLHEHTVDMINRGAAPIHERDLDDLVARATAAGRLRAELATEDAIGEAELVLICVGTPSHNGAIDLSHVLSASRLAGRWLARRPGFAAIVIKSTVLPGTTDTLVRQAIESASGRTVGPSGFGLGMNPEFLREGDAVADFMNPDRIVLGHEDPGTLRLLQRLYAPWSCAKLVVNSRTAEMIKYANNALLALQISAVNEMANIASQVGGIDFMDVHRGVALDKRWNPVRPGGGRVDPAILSYLVPGCGFGGSCFPKDVEALRTLALSHGIEPRILQAVLDVNTDQPMMVVQPFIDALGGDVRGRTILLLGLAFKPGTDDIRESASLRMAQHLASLGARVLAHDPVAARNAAAAAGPSLEIIPDWQDALPLVDGVIVATCWPEYADLAGLAEHLAGKPILDARRMFDPRQFPGVRFLGVGRNSDVYRTSSPSRISP